MKAIFTPVVAPTPGTSPTAGSISNKNASSGDSSSIEMIGEDSVGVSAGSDCKIKGIKGCWITLSEWTYDEKKKRSVPVCVKSVKIDGKNIKENVFYTLKKGGFVEADK